MLNLMVLAGVGVSAPIAFYVIRKDKEGKESDDQPRKLPPQAREQLDLMIERIHYTINKWYAGAVVEFDRASGLSDDSSSLLFKELIGSRIFPVLQKQICETETKNLHQCFWEFETLASDPAESAAASASSWRSVKTIPPSVVGIPERELYTRLSSRIKDWNILKRYLVETLTPLVTNLAKRKAAFFEFTGQIEKRRMLSSTRKWSLFSKSHQSDKKYAVSRAHIDELCRLLDKDMRELYHAVDRDCFGNEWYLKKYLVISSRVLAIKKCLDIWK